MSTIVAGTSLGLFNGGNELGLTGAAFGQAGSRYYVNGVSGNLVVQRQDQVLVGHGQDTSLVRTYNSMGTISGFDNWYFQFEQRLESAPASDATGAKIYRIAADGFRQEFVYDTTQQFYVSTDGAGAHDTLQRVSPGVNEWTYTEGSTLTKERYKVTIQHIFPNR